MPEEPLDTVNARVTIRTKRGRLTIGPEERIEGLWRICQRELRTNDQVRAMCGRVTRHTLIAWRQRAQHPFPAPVVRLPQGKSTLELFSRSEVEDWFEAELRRRAARAAS